MPVVPIHKLPRRVYPRERLSLDAQLAVVGGAVGENHAVVGAAKVLGRERGKGVGGLGAGGGKGEQG